MKQKAAERAVHAVIAFMLSAGIVIPILGVMDHSFTSPRVLLLCLIIIAAFEVVSLHRVAAFSAAGGAAAALAVWLFSSGGARIVSDYLLAVTLRIRGIENALPLMADQAVRITACVLTVLCCFACLRRATCIPAFALCVGAAILIWISGRTSLIPWLLPALAAALTMMMMSRCEDARPLRILPWSAGIVAAAFFLTGSGAVIEPLKDKADELRQAIMDRLFFVEARDVFSLYAVGYSPQGQNQLGGKPNPDEAPVMTVNASRTVYLRGSIYDQYDGHGWRNTAGGKRFLWQSDRAEKASVFNLDLPSESVPDARGTEETVTVQMLNSSASTLFVPQRIRKLNTGGDMVAYYANSSEVFITRNLRSGDSYEVSGPLYVSGDPGMGQILEICAAMKDSSWENMPDIYTQIPDHLSPVLYSMVQEITDGAGTPYDRAVRIQEWLAGNYQYTLDVADHPENMDFVTTFLLDTKKGYCTYFASAMTVLCRMAGLPARYVEGYLAEPDSGGKALVTGMNAHAWTEVYFKGFGWLTFDATPKQGPTSQPDGNNPSEQGDAASTPEPTQEEPTPTPEPPEEEPTPTPEPPEEEPTPTPEPPEEEPTPTPEPGGEEPTPSPPESEPTPTGNEPDPTPEAEPEDGRESTPEPEESPNEPSSDPEQSAEQQSDRSFPWGIWIILAVLILTAVRITVTSPAFRSRRAQTEEKRFHIWIQEVFDLLSAEKLTRKPDETPMGFLRRVDAGGTFSTILGPVGEYASLMRYSTAEPLDSDTAVIREKAVSLRKEINRPARARYWIRRIFTSFRSRSWTG